MHRTGVGGAEGLEGEGVAGKWHAGRDGGAGVPRCATGRAAATGGCAAVCRAILSVCHGEGRQRAPAAATRRRAKMVTNFPHQPGDGRDGAPAWSAVQLARLGEEWRQLRRAFAYHGAVEVVPLSGEPPSEYQVNYKVTTLAIDEAGQLAYVDGCSVHLWLPPHFPHNAPIVRPLATLFHPNVALEWVHLNPAWRPESTLVDVVAQVGFLLAFQSYDPAAVANPVAMNWVFANPHLLPTDPAASFSPAAGGDPLSRVTQFGPQTLQDFQHRVESTIDRLVSADAFPSPDELEQLSRDARTTLPPFLAPDIPELLRHTAAELRDLAASLHGPDPVWSQIGRQIVLSKSIADAADDVVRAEETVRRAIAGEATDPVALSPAAANSSDSGGQAPAAPRRRRTHPAAVAHPAGRARPA